MPVVDGCTDGRMDETEFIGPLLALPGVQKTLPNYLLKIRENNHRVINESKNEMFLENFTKHEKRVRDRQQNIFVMFSSSLAATVLPSSLL